MVTDPGTDGDRRLPTDLLRATHLGEDGTRSEVAVQVPDQTEKTLDRPSSGSTSSSLPSELGFAPLEPESPSTRLQAPGLSGPRATDSSKTGSPSQGAQV